MTCLWMWLSMVSQDAASFHDMQNDVEEAIQWVQQNQQRLYNDLVDIPVYFGGYSSGAHVAVSVLQRNARLMSFFQGIVLVSGVLAVRPEALPTSDDSSSPPPRWLTDLLLQLGFGPKEAQSIPSPIAGTIPALPHLMIGCEKEVWGLPFLDTFFCSPAYADKARQQGISVHYQEIPSTDHWFILSHSELPQILATQLPRLSRSRLGTISSEETNNDPVHNDINE